jgi:hypothetical protein
MHLVLLITSCSVLCPRIVFAPSSRSILVRIISGYSSHYGLIILRSLLSIISVLSTLIAAACFVLLSFRALFPLVPSAACVSSRFCVVSFVLSTLRSRLYAPHRFVLRALYPLSFLCC